MRPRQLLATALALLSLPLVARAQTAEIQREVETRLWFHRALAWVQEVTGAPPAVSILTLITLMLSLVAVAWLWKARRNDAPK